MSKTALNIQIFRRLFSLPDSSVCSSLGYIRSDPGVWCLRPGALLWNALHHHSPRLLMPSHPRFEDSKITALVMTVPYQHQDKSRLIRCCDHQDPGTIASHEDILVRHLLAIKSIIYPTRRESEFMLHDEYCNSNPIALKGWSFLFISMEDPRVNSSSLTLPSHSSPIFQF
jgi:hypothetical protein